MQLRIQGGHMKMQNWRGIKKSGKQPPICVSQNYLTSRKTIDRLLNLTNIEKKDFIIEIGAGKGHITKSLIQKCGRLQAVEIDEKLYDKLKISLGNKPTLSIIHMDFLKMQLPSNQPYKIFSNIPFTITSDIIRKITQTGNPPTEVWLVMEKGAAKRFCGTSFENIHSLRLKPFWDLNIIYYFRRDDFHPMPSVETVLIHLSKKKQPDLEPQKRKEYCKFLSHALKYGVFGAKSLLTKKQVSTALRLAGLPQVDRSEKITYNQWLCLFQCYQKYGKKLSL